MIYLLVVLAILHGLADCTRGMNGMNEQGMDGMNGRSNGMQSRRTGGLTHGVSGRLSHVDDQEKAGKGEFEDWETIHSLCQNAANPMMTNMAGKQGRMGKGGQMGGQEGGMMNEGGMNQRGMNGQMGRPGQISNGNMAGMFNTIVTYFYLGDGENNPLVRHLSNIQYEHGKNVKFFKIHVSHYMKKDFHHIFGNDAKFPLIAICRDGAITDKVNEGSIIEMFLRGIFMT